MSVAITPNNDIDEHDEFSTACKCEPMVICEPDCEMVIVHNSFDGREAVEWAQALLEDKPYYRGDGPECDFTRPSV